MQKQQRILIGDIGNAFATICADHFRRRGVWATTCPQGIEELRAAIRRDHPDMLLLSTDSLFMDYTYFADEIHRIYDIRVTLLVSTENAFLEHSVHRAGIDCLMMPANMNELALLLTKQFRLSCHGEDEQPSKMDLEIEITNLLYGFGISANLRGFHYLRRAIMTAYAISGRSSVMMTDIYPAVAERFQSTVGRVERAIRHAITQAWNMPISDQAFSYRRLPVMQNHKPTNSEFIAFAVDRLKLRHADGKDMAME